MGGTGWPIIPLPAKEAYNRVLREAGVFAVRDRVDKETIGLIGVNKEVRIDAPGGCCVKDEICQGKVDTQDQPKNKPDRMVKGSDCRLTPCLDDEMMKGSDKCDAGKGDGMLEAAIAGLNEDIQTKPGVDWASSEWACVGNCDFSHLEEKLETCLHPYMKDGTMKCTEGGGGGGGGERQV